MTTVAELDLPELDLGSGEERLIADPHQLDGGSEDVPPEERARRERAREQGGGIVAYATDRPVTMAAFALSGQLYVAEFAAGLTPRHEGHTDTDAGLHPLR